jgi:hypothetical protein
MDAHAALALLQDLNENYSEGGEEMDQDTSDIIMIHGEWLSISGKGSISVSR